MEGVVPLTIIRVSNYCVYADSGYDSVFCEMATEHFLYYRVRALPVWQSAASLCPQTGQKTHKLVAVHLFLDHLSDYLRFSCQATMRNEDLPLLPSRLSPENTTEGQPPSPPPNLTEDIFEPPQFDIPFHLVHPDIANTAKLAYGTGLKFLTAWTYRIQDQAETDRDIKPTLRPTTYEMIMTLITLEGPKRLPTDPLPPPTAPARPPFHLEIPPEFIIEDSVKDLEAVVYSFNIPESLRQLFSEIGQIIWSSDWLRFFLIRQPYRLPLGADMFYGVLRWWICTDEMIIAAFLAQKMKPGLRAEVNYYIPSAQVIRRFKERNEMWTAVIDEVAKVRRKLCAGVSMVFHAKLGEERDKIQKDTPPPAPRRRKTPRSSLDQEICAQSD